MDRGSQALGAALTFAVAVTLFTWGGYRADQELDSGPLLLIVGALIGGVGGFLHIVMKLSPESLPWGTAASESDPPAPPDNPSSESEATEAGRSGNE